MSKTARSRAVSKFRTSNKPQKKLVFDDIEHGIETRLGDDAADAAAALDAYERSAAAQRGREEAAAIRGALDAEEREDAAYWAAHPRSVASRSAVALARPAGAREYEYS